MPKIYTHTVPLAANIVDAFCLLQKGFTDQFVYYDKQRANRFMGLGRCIALSSLAEADVVYQGPETSLAQVDAAAGAAAADAVGTVAAGAVAADAATADAAAAPIPREPIFFSFNRFDAENPAPPDSMMAAFPRLRLMLPEVVLIENEAGAFLQVNSLGPVYPGRVERFCRHAREAKPRMRRAIPYTLGSANAGVGADAVAAADASVADAAAQGDFDAWREELARIMRRIDEGRVQKVVPSRRVELRASEPFSSKDVLVNLVDGDAAGTVFLYRYGDVFFCGCTPELLVRKRGEQVESMCLAGTAPCGGTPEECERLAEALLRDDKNRREHEHVVSFMREVFGRNCHDVRIPAEPTVRAFRQVQHLFTPVAAKVLEGRTLLGLASQLHPTPALAGAPVGEALMCLREAEAYNRGFFGGTVGYVDAVGNGEFSVAIRSGVFDGERGWVYAGCGVVEGSDARAEYEETALKMQTVLSAFE